MQWRFALSRNMRENPDGFPSSPGATRRAAPIPVCGWDLFEQRADIAVLCSGENEVIAGGTPANPAAPGGGASKPDLGRDRSRAAARKHAWRRGAIVQTGVGS